MRRLALLLAAALLLGGAPALAATPSPVQGGLSVVPDQASSRLSKDRNSLRAGSLRPGEGFQDRAFVLNTTDRPVRVALYPADGIAAQGGGFGYSDRNVKPTGLGSWLTLSARELTVPAGGRLPVSIALRVGADAINGLNVGAVVAEPLDQAGSGPVQTVTRFAMPVALTVVGGRTAPPTATAVPGRPGDAPGSVTVTQLRPRPRGDRLCPSVVVSNQSGAPANVEVATRSSGGLTGGSTSTTRRVTVPALSTSTVEAPCVRRPVGPGEVRVTVRAAAEPPVAASAGVFWAFSPVAIAALLLLLLILALLATLLRGLRRKRESELTSPTASAT